MPYLTQQMKDEIHLGFTMTQDDGPHGQAIRELDRDAQLVVERHRKWIEHYAIKATGESLEAIANRVLIRSAYEIVTTLLLGLAAGWIAKGFFQ